MTGHSFPAAPGRFLPLLLASLLWLGVAGPATGADGEVLTPSETPRALSGDGDEAFVVEGPFSLAWQNAGGRFAVEATAEGADKPAAARSEEHTSELQSLMRISYAVFCLKKKKKSKQNTLAKQRHTIPCN